MLPISSFFSLPEISSSLSSKAHRIVLIGNVYISCLVVSNYKTLNLNFYVFQSFLRTGARGELGGEGFDFQKTIGILCKNVDGSSKGFLNNPLIYL